MTTETNIRVFVPSDSTAVSLDADAVAAAIQQQAAAEGRPVTLVRNGSRGLCWLEPLVEVETPLGRVAYGPVSPDDVPALAASGFWQGEQGHPLCQGFSTDIPYLAKQQRVTFARAGIIDPLSLDDYRSQRGFAGLEQALQMSGQALVDAVKASGLRGRGGAAFPTGIKWQTVHDAPAE
ncbi:MAG: formate dehydrogenase, partial [Thiothrix sp.]|nr:formate dehydrogenase [Thiothrix sp.]